MAKLSETRSSAVEFDGASVLHVQNGTPITFSTVSQKVNYFVPWACTIQKVYLTVHTLATITDLFMHLGTSASAAAYLSGYRVDASATGNFEISTVTTVVTQWVSQSVAAGSNFQITFTTGGTAVVSVMVVLSPNNASLYT